MAVYPYAYCVSDQDGFYITSEGETIAKAKKPIKAWHKAAEAIENLRKKSKKKDRAV